ncbi:uncharacterized protein LOC113225708 [Hyposmocoma kahamanoa]|uniref:uncharacterized protein LOC113225708 n=1 Tax=Hyposmocoma kahamanoa TaxID=1477025 RepID=UPI000E6D802B|nr:uncharacterized protein LOC113225708 [Hyposmocoma kahamanoa]
MLQLINHASFSREYQPAHLFIHHYIIQYLITIESVSHVRTKNSKFIALTTALIWLPVAVTEEQHIVSLNRILKRFKYKFSTDFNEIANFEIEAKFICTPNDYSDSFKWNFDSAMRLIISLHESKSFRPLLKAFQRMLKVNGLLKNNDPFDDLKVKIHYFCFCNEI